MPVINSIADNAEEMREWRRYLHQHPELDFDCHQTAAFVVEKLKSFGITEIHEGIATSGVVAIIEGQAKGPTIGLRADMDALPMPDMSGAEHASLVDGVSHACGHDGHTTMLLGAARYLAETRNFKGRVALLFQPAEEGGGGGLVMVQEGVMDRFDISQVYALHNAPGLPVGHIETAPGPVMAAVDKFFIKITGVGGHAAVPELTVDPVPPALALAQALDTISSRNRAGAEAMVVSLAQINAGTAFNIIAGHATLGGTVRTFTPEARDLVERRMTEISAGIGAAFNVDVDLTYSREYPATVNHKEETLFAAGVAAEIVGEAAVSAEAAPAMVAEDFSYMLEARPGSYLMLGQGDTPMCHHPAYDFNDDIAPIGASFFARLVERAQPLGGDDA